MGGLFLHCVGALLGFSRRDAADELRLPAVVEPVDKLQRGELDGRGAAQELPPVDDLGLIGAVDRLGKRVVIETRRLRLARLRHGQPAMTSGKR